MKIERLSIGGQLYGVNPDAIAAHLTDCARAGTLLAVLRHYVNMKVIQLTGYCTLQTFEDDGELGSMRVGSTVIEWDVRSQQYQTTRLAA